MCQSMLITVILRKINTNHHVLYLLLCSVIFPIWTIRDLRSCTENWAVIYRQGSVSCIISMHVLSNRNFFWPKSELGFCSCFFSKEKTKTNKTKPLLGFVWNLQFSPSSTISSIYFWITEFCKVSVCSRNIIFHISFQSEDILLLQKFTRAQEQVLFTAWHSAREKGIFNAGQDSA